MKKIYSLLAVASLCTLTMFAAKSYVMAAAEGEDAGTDAPASEIQGTPFKLSAGSGCDIPLPSGTPVTYNFSGQWNSVELVPNTFKVEEVDSVVIKFAEAPACYYNVPYKKSADGDIATWNAVGDQEGKTQWNIAVTEDIYGLWIQNTQEGPSSFVFLEAYSVKKDGTHEPIKLNCGWGASTRVDVEMTSATATLSGKWGGVTVSNDILGKEGRKTLRIYTDEETDLTDFPIQWCIKTVDGTDAWPQIGVINAHYAECKIDDTLQSIFLQYTDDQTRTLGIKAITWELSEIPVVEPGDYIVKNVATGKYLGGANSWGTQASLVDHGSIFTLTILEDGKYTLDSHTYNSDAQHFLGNNAYVDANAYGFNLYRVEGGVAIAIDENNAFGAPAEGSALATGLAYDDAAAAWEFISYDQMIASLKNATETSPLDATFAIKAPNFNRNHYTKETYPWIVSDDCINKNLQGGMNENKCAESYHSTFDIYQILTGMPNGVYALQAQGFYRADGEFTNTPVFYINEETGEFPVRTGSENSMNDASNSFSAGKYSINLIYVQVENGEIRLGVKNETETNLWCIWDNFELTYYGADANITDLKNAALIAKVDELLAEIKLLNEEYAETKMETSAKQALGYYADENNKPSVSNEEELNAAIETLTNVINNAKNSVNEYAQARKMADIYAKYAEGAGIALNMEDFDLNYENGTLSLEEGNPIINEYKTGLDQLIDEGKNITEDFIQNAGFETRNVEGWTAEGLHIAGNKNFPLMTGEDFVEMWTPGPGTLAEAKIEQTVTLPAGKYLLTAEAQLLQQGDATVTPEGFYLFAGDKQTWISNIATTFAVSFTLEEETEIALGAKVKSCTGNWASIDNFQLFAMNYDLTKEMFMKWDNYDATAKPVGDGNGAYDFGVSTGLPYGDDMVFGNKFADLTNYSVLALTVTEGTPCLFFNRPGMGCYQPGYIEIKSENSPYVIGVKENVWYIDLAKITVKDGYAHLNCIRGADWNYVTITEAKLYVKDNITTGINETFANTTQNGKFLQNGKIVIMKNGKAYTTTGTRILK